MSQSRPASARTFPLAAIALAAVAAACSGNPPLMANEDTMQLASTSLREKPWLPTALDPVTLELEMPATVKRGGVLPIKIHMHNGSAQPIAIGFGMRQGYDLLVAQPGMRPDSGVVWSPFKQPTTSRDATTTDPLRPGRDTTFEVNWPTSDDFGHLVPVGEYRVRATVAAALLSTRAIWTRWVPVHVTQ